MDAAGSRAQPDGLAGRYQRIAQQIAELFVKNSDPLSRMATAVALMHHKLPHFFWTGFYRLEDGQLIVGPYQGPLACSILTRDVGVCWACVTRAEPIIVPNVHEFPGHIACDSRSNSELVVPVMDSTSTVRGVLDVDSADLDAFSVIDAAGLSQIAGMIYSDPAR